MTTTFACALSDLRAAQKPARGVSLYSRWVNRPAGRVLAAAAAAAGLTPNTVTALSAAVTFTGIALIALVPPSWGLAAGVCALLVLGFALDAADGQLARLLGAGGPAGEWLDHVVDCAKTVALHMALLVAFHRFPARPGEGWLLVPAAYQFTAVVTFFGGILTEQLRRREGAPGAAGAPSTLRAIGLLPADYGLFCLLFPTYAVPRLFLVVYTVLLAANVLIMAALLVKWFRLLDRSQAAARPARAPSG